MGRDAEKKTLKNIRLKIFYFQFTEIKELCLITIIKLLSKLYIGRIIKKKLYDVIKSKKRN